jgi:hypothetical protein
VDLLLPTLVVVETGALIFIGVRAWRRYRAAHTTPAPAPAPAPASQPAAAAAKKKATPRAAKKAKR